MLLKSETSEVQKMLAEYCRNGELKNLPGTNTERIKEYKRLIHNIIHESIAKAFPITLEVLEESEWNNLVNSFIQNHNCQSPEIWKMPYEFYEYITENNFQENIKYPFLKDLLYFEWLEIEIYTMEDKDIDIYNKEGDYMNDLIYLNPEYKIVNLEYPVHLYPAKDCPSKKGNYFLLVFRHQESLEVKFLDISILHVWILEKISIEKSSLTTILLEASKTFQADFNTLENHVLLFLNNMKNEGLLIGFQTINI